MGGLRCVTAGLAGWLGCVYSFLYTSEGGRTNPTATLHEGTGYHGTTGLPHG